MTTPCLSYLILKAPTRRAVLDRAKDFQPDYSVMSPPSKISDTPTEFSMMLWKPGTVRRNS